MLHFIYRMNIIHRLFAPLIKEPININLSLSYNNKK